MRARLTVVLMGAAIAAIWMVPKATAQEPGNDWWWVCHQRGNGSYDALIIGSSRAAARHEAHGDPPPVSYIGQPAPPCGL